MGLAALPFPFVFTLVDEYGKKDGEKSPSLFGNFNNWKSDIH
jgi:hypothetical protein